MRCEDAMKASDIMTHRVITISPDATILDAVRLMTKNRISGMPVVDESGKLVGVVSEADFLHRPETGTVRKPLSWFSVFFRPNESAQDYVRSHGTSVREIMTPDPVTIEGDTPLDEVVHLMEAHNVKRLPVMQRGKLVGIVTRVNLMRALASLHRTIPKSRETDSTIRERILADIDRQDWSTGVLVDVAVHDGVVDLWGTIADEAQREALDVLAKNTPGVRQVHEHLIWDDEAASDRW